MRTLLVAQPRDVGLGKPDRQVGGLMVVAAPQDLAALIDPRQSLAIGQRDIQSNSSEFVFEPMIDQLQECLATLSRDGRQRDAVRIAQGMVREARPRHGIEEIGLVHHLDHPVFDRIAAPELGEHAEHIPALGLAVGMIGVTDMDDDIGFGDLLEGRPEGGDKMGGQIRNEADRVRQDNGPP